MLINNKIIIRISFSHELIVATYEESQTYSHAFQEACSCEHATLFIKVCSSAIGIRFFCLDSVSSGDDDHTNPYSETIHVEDVVISLSLWATHRCQRVHVQKTKRRVPDGHVLLACRDLRVLSSPLHMSALLWAVAKHVSSRKKWELPLLFCHFFRNECCAHFDCTKHAGWWTTICSPLSKATAVLITRFKPMPDCVAPSRTALVSVGWQMWVIYNCVVLGLAVGDSFLWSWLRYCKQQ